MFKIKSDYIPTPDQEKAINNLTKANEYGANYQVLLGVTGSGKTFTIANVIKNLNKPTLIISHNKTLASQLYQEFRDYFPQNSVNYFVSYYDYYQPEAYIPSTDTYIEKDAGINLLIDKLRLAATSNLLTRKDTIVIASVSCIYNIGSPMDYKKSVLKLNISDKIDHKYLINRFLELQYERSEFDFQRGTFRIRGTHIDIYPSYKDNALRIELVNDRISKLMEINPLTGEVKKQLSEYYLFPAKHFITDSQNNRLIIDQIKKDCQKRVNYFEKLGKNLEAYRLKNKVAYDLEMINELGYVKGIENYSRYFDGRNKGDPPYTLLDYFSFPYSKDWLVVIDESHITFPQIRGMYNGDLSRKKTLIDYGFRLPAAIDNRPLTFDEFMKKIPNFIATSATPGDWELSLSNEDYQNAKNKFNFPKGNLTEQLYRPTGIPDPTVSIRSTKNQVKDIMQEIKLRAEKRQRTLVTTLTKKTAEDLSEYLKSKGLNVHYLHSDIKTLERGDILDDLRSGKYDCLIGINLLREGLDLPEVSLVAILDADKEGFLRSEVTLIQTMGRAARHSEGEVILYADRMTNSMKNALREVARRREIQLKENKRLGVSPKSIHKPIRKRLIDEIASDNDISLLKSIDNDKTFMNYQESLTPFERKRFLKNLEKEMKLSAMNLNFELAIKIRDKIKMLK